MCIRDRFWEVDADGKPSSRKPILEPWKCPYHNGRMCMEDVYKRQQQRNVDLLPEFVNGKYAFYTRPMDDFIDTRCV